MKRASGILLPLFSLPSKRGRGDMGPEAYRFIDKLSMAGQRYWQVLPIGPANDKDCPYQSTSAFAGDPAYISLEKLEQRGLLDADRLSFAKANRSASSRDEVLRSAYLSFRLRGSGEELRAFDLFCEKEAEWLDDFALYTALSDRLGRDWSRWDEDISRCREEAKAYWRDELSEEIGFRRWLQFEFFTQWEDLRAYAHEKGVRVIGDIPYSVAFESADCWADRRLFRIDEEGNQTETSGVPPDQFTPKGQCWNNPLYDWNVHREDGYRWWIRRISQQLRFFDILRIDHIRGFESYYAIPGDDRDPMRGHWEKGPGMDFFGEVNRIFGSDRFIAEDLGFLTQQVHDMIRDTGYPGMKVLQFAFDTSEENIYLPSNYEDNNCAVYTGTHDNDTTLGWYEKAEEWKKRFLTWYLREKSCTRFSKDRADLSGGSGEDPGIMDPEDAVRGMVELAYSSRADICIIPMQDHLGLGSHARINTPGVADGNWRWQMDEDAFTDELAEGLKALCREYDR